MIYAVKNLFTRTPIQISGAIVTLLNAAIGVGWIHWTGTQVGWANTAVIAVLGLFVNSTTTNTAKLQDVADAATGAPGEGQAPPSPAVVVTSVEPVPPAKPAKKAAKKAK